jgi:hypothetical protein
MNAVLENRSRTVTMALTLCALTLFIPACRPAPISTPPTSTAQFEVQENATPQDIPAEMTKRDEPPTVTKPPRESIARLLPESLIGVPNKDPVSRRVEYNTLVGARSSATPPKIAWQYRATRAGEIVGFEFSNHGGNPILPPRRDASKNQLFTRDFQFRFDERARQDIHLMVSDWVPSRDREFRLSEIMNSLMLFFPRKILPAIVNAGERNIVTLPTGELVEFDAATHEIRGGVLSEAAVDFNTERGARRFPGVDYRGNGVVVRVNARGTDPRIGTVATITTGTPPPNCDRGRYCNVCQVPSKELWDQSGAERFKFSTDAEFERFLIARCGFGLPKIDADAAVSAVQ